MGWGADIRRAAVEKVQELFTVPPLEAALARFTRDHQLSDLVARLAPANRQYQHPAYRQVIRHGITFMLDISDYQDWILYWGLTTDRASELYLLLQPDYVVFDVGTSLGEVCMTAAGLVGPQGMVYAFEPDPISFRKLTGNLALNRFGNIFASNLGLGDRPATRQMVVDPGNRGSSRVQRHPAPGESFSIHIETLDSFVAQRELQRLDVLKVDVEGFELSVLKGAHQALGRFRPRLFVTVSDRNLRQQGGSAVELIAFIRAAGYSVHRAGTGEEIDERADFGVGFEVICRPLLR
jgi:FkbM family methyltransferase